MGGEGDGEGEVWGEEGRGVERNKGEENRGRGIGREKESGEIEGEKR